MVRNASRVLTTSRGNRHFGECWRTGHYGACKFLRPSTRGRSSWTQDGNIYDAKPISDVNRPRLMDTYRFMATITGAAVSNTYSSGTSRASVSRIDSITVSGFAVSSRHRPARKKNVTAPVFRVFKTVAPLRRRRFSNGPEARRAAGKSESAITIVFGSRDAS